MSVAIKALPTFRIYRDGNEAHVGEVTGTKIDVLKGLVDEQLGAM